MAPGSSSTTGVSAASHLQAAWLRRGPLAIVLLPIAWLYGALIGLRRLAYGTGLLRTRRLPVPVIVVGNLVAGGAGKTPTAMAIVDLLRSRGHTPGIVSRGYGRDDGAPALVGAASSAREVGDEPLLMHLRARVPVAVGADRTAAGQLLLTLHPEVDVIVSDDGLQHWRLARDAQVIVFDERGAGNGWLLPAGPLRERLPARLPPRTVALYNAQRPTTPLPGHLARRSLRGVTRLEDWWAGRAASAGVLEQLRTQGPVVAAAGMAHPQRYFEMLRSLGLSVVEMPLPDHHDYETLPWPAGTPDVVVTEKDAVKLSPQRAGVTRVWVATLDFEVDNAFAEELLQWLPPAPTR